MKAIKVIYQNKECGNIWESRIDAIKEANELYAKLNEFDPLEEESNIQLSYTNESQGHTVTLQLERPTNDTFYRIKDKNKWEHYETLKPIEHPEYYFPVILP